MYAKTIKARRRAGARTILFLLLATASWADILPPATTLAECVDRTLVDQPDNCSLSGFDATASGSLTLSPFISLTSETASGPINSLFIPGAGVFVSAKYSFEVVGGTPGDIVPIFISTNLTTAASSSHAYGFAEAVIHTSFGNKSAVVCTDGSCGTTDTSFSGTLGSSALSGEVGDTIQLEVEASSGDSLLAEFANASADPFIFIDPSFAGAANYHIEVSPGVANGPLLATPEPGSWMLLGTACAALLISRRRARS